MINVNANHGNVNFCAKDKFANKLARNLLFNPQQKSILQDKFLSNEVKAELLGNTMTSSPNLLKYIGNGLANLCVKLFKL